MEINRKELLNQLGIEEPIAETTEVEKVATVGGLQVNLTEITVSVKISPRNTYSSAETSMTLAVSGADKETKAGIKLLLQNEVIDYTVKTCLKALQDARQAELL